MRVVKRGGPATHPERSEQAVLPVHALAVQARVPDSIGFIRTLLASPARTLRNGLITQEIWMVTIRNLGRNRAAGRRFSREKQGTVEDATLRSEKFYLLISILKRFLPEGTPSEVRPVDSSAAERGPAASRSPLT